MAASEASASHTSRTPTKVPQLQHQEENIKKTMEALKKQNTSFSGFKVM